MDSLGGVRCFKTDSILQGVLGHSRLINKCLSGKSTGYDSFRLSQAQILWGMYHKKNVDFAYLLWEDFVYQVEHKYAKKSNEMYYPRFTKVIINFFMTKDLSISRRNKFGTILPVELTNEDIKNSADYKEYYANASGANPPKTKASIRKTRSSSNTTMPPPAAAGTRLLTLAKRKQHAKLSKVKDEGTGIIPGVPDVSTDKSDEEIFWKSSDEDDDDDVDDQSETDDDDDDDQEDEDEQDDDDQESDNDGDDFVHPKLSTYDEEAKDKESFDPIVQTPSHVEDSDDESNDDESHGMIVRGDEEPDAKDDDEELYRDVNINLESQQQSSSVSYQFFTSIFNPSPDASIDSHFESTPRVDVPVTTTVVPILVTALTLPSPSIPIMSQVQQAPAPTPIIAPRTSLQDLPNFGSLFGFDHRLKTLEANFSEFMQTNRFAEAVSSIPEIVDRYIDHRMNEAVEIIKEQVKVQVFKILPKIENTVNEQLEAEVLTRSSNSSKTSYVVAADLSEMELKKILIEKMESNKSIYRSDEQRNLYKALVDAYECDEIILDTYEDTVTLKRHRDDANKDEEPSAGSDRGSKRKREGKEPESISAPKEKASKTTATHKSIQPWISDLAKQADSRTLFNKLMDTPMDFSAFLMNRLKVDTLTPELLAGLTYELMKGSCKSLVELEFFLEEVVSLEKSNKNVIGL
nr:hypothetical protein [Tanacetum cinerariifolium]